MGFRRFPCLNVGSAPHACCERANKNKSPSLYCRENISPRQGSCGVFFAVVISVIAVYFLLNKIFSSHFELIFNQLSSKLQKPGIMQAENMYRLCFLLLLLYIYFLSVPSLLFDVFLFFLTAWNDRNHVTGSRKTANEKLLLMIRSSFGVVFGVPHLFGKNAAKIRNARRRQV